MRPSRPVLVAAAALLLLACGESREEKRLKELKRICEASVGGTVAQLEQAFGIPILLAVRRDGSGNVTGPTCGTDVTTLECAEGPSHCVLGFLFDRSSDPNTCEPSGCYFTCDVRAVQDDLKAHEEIGDHAATICGARWMDGQPVPPFYDDFYWTPGMLP